MYNHTLRPLQRLCTAGNQMLPRLGQNTDRHIVGNQPFFNQITAKGKLRITRTRKTDLDLFKTHLNQKVEKTYFLLNIHRVDQRLVSVAQIDRTPHRHLSNLSIRPFSVG